MGGRERNPNPAFQAFVTGIYAPTAEGGTAFFSPRFPPLFLFARILAVPQKLFHNENRTKLGVTVP